MAADPKNKCKADKRRETKVVRVYAGDQWVDVEALTHASFDGKQWRGHDTGNQSQETIYEFNSAIAGNTGGDSSTIETVPDTKNMSVTVHSKQSAMFETRDGRVQLFMKNEINNCQRNKEDRRRRIQFNNIDAEFLSGGQPPSDPEEYMEAIKKSKDSSDIWLDVFMPKEVVFVRNLDLRQQEIFLKDTWGPKVNVPGGGGETDKKRDHVRLDPFQVVVNFGPDGLAVHFDDGDD